MRIDERLLAKIPELKPYSKVHFDGLSAKAKAFCDTNDIPAELVHCLTSYDLASTLNEYFALPDGFVELNDLGDERFNPIRERLFVVGSGTTGDPLAIDLHTGKIGFISHDEIYEHEKVRDVFCAISPSLGEFCKRGVVEQNLPRDYYEAVEELRKGIGG